MYTWPADLTEYRTAVRRFVEKEVAPHRDALEDGSLPPYDILRRFYAAFGLDVAAKERFHRRLAFLSGETDEAPAREDSAGATLVPLIEFGRHAPGMVTALGVSVSLTAGAILREGSVEQQRRWAEDLLVLRKVGAWAITEPGSGSDAYAMLSTAKRVDEGWVLNGSKTFITNGPYADTIVFICRDADAERKDRSGILTFVLDSGMPGLLQTKPMRKMGMHSSPTGELVLEDVVVGEDRRLAGAPKVPKAKSSGVGAAATFAVERASVTAMALGIIERSLELSLEYAKTRVQFGKPIGEFQLIQLKLANMEVARLNVENLVLRYIEMADNGARPTLAEASAMKLYAARNAVECAMEAVQLFGGNGYMSEFSVEQLARDAKVLQIYGGTDEMQVRSIAKDLLRRGDR
jgi:acyl-CoA dehydrogenase